MEEAILRFPHLAENIFQILDCQNLLKCKMVSRYWKNFIEHEKFYYFQLIKSLTNCSDESLKKIFPKTNLKAAMTMFSKFMKVFSVSHNGPIVLRSDYDKKANPINFYNMERTPARA